MSERAAAGDLEARNTLVEHNLRLVAHIIKKYYTQTADQGGSDLHRDDRADQGREHLRPDRNIKLTTYASRCIENAILS